MNPNSTSIPAKSVNAFTIAWPLSLNIKIAVWATIHGYSVNRNGWVYGFDTTTDLTIYNGYTSAQIIRAHAFMLGR